MRNIAINVGIFLCLGIHALEEKPIVIEIASYNNAAYYKKNLDSVRRQNYTNFRIIYVDDCSADGTGKLVQSYIHTHKMQDRFTLIRNEQRMGAMANHYRAIWSCLDDEIIVQLDGDDFLAHPNVLKRINQEYQDPNVWLTYGQFRWWSTGKKGFCREMPEWVIEHNAFRDYEWLSAHLRTFYAGLFKQVPLRDFLSDGDYLQVTCDMAIMFPLLEMAAEHIRFIPDVLYTYNDKNPINDSKRDLDYQVAYDKKIRRMPMYQALAEDEAIWGKKHTRSGCCSDDALEQVIDISILAHMNQLTDTGIIENYLKKDFFENIYLLYASDEQREKVESLQAEYSCVIGIRQDDLHYLKSILDTPRKRHYILYFPRELSTEVNLSEHTLRVLTQSKASIFNCALSNEKARRSMTNESMQNGVSIAQTPSGFYLCKFESQQGKEWYKRYQDMPQLIDGKLLGQVLRELTACSKITDAFKDALDRFPDVLYGA